MPVDKYKQQAEGKWNRHGSVPQTRFDTRAPFKMPRYHMPLTLIEWQSSRSLTHIYIGGTVAQTKSIYTVSFTLLCGRCQSGGADRMAPYSNPRPKTTTTCATGPKGRRNPHVTIPNNIYADTVHCGDLEERCR
jgi:hypothetical protein